MAEEIKVSPTTDIETLLEAMLTAGRLTGKVLDGWYATKYERECALSQAHSALGSAYFKLTGQPLEWWTVEPIDEQEEGA